MPGAGMCCFRCLMRETAGTAPLTHTYASRLYFGREEIQDVWDAHEQWAMSSPPLMGVSSYCIRCFRGTWRTAYQDMHEALLDSVVKKQESVAFTLFTKNIRYA